MNIAKDCLDVGLYTNRYDALRAFYVDRLGLPYEELLKAGRSIHQHRVGLYPNPSVSRVTMGTAGFPQRNLLRALLTLACRSIKFNPLTKRYLV